MPVSEWMRCVPPLREKNRSTIKGEESDEIKKAAKCAAFLRNPMVEVAGIEPASERSSSRESHVRLQ